MNELNTILLLIFSELVIVGVWASTGKGMILEVPASFADDFLPVWVTMPLYDCTVCMSSTWGSIIWWIGHKITLPNLIWWPFFVLALAGLGKLTGSLLEVKEL